MKPGADEQNARLQGPAVRTVRAADEPQPCNNQAARDRAAWTQRLLEGPLSDHSCFLFHTCQISTV